MYKDTINPNLNWYTMNQFKILFEKYLVFIKLQLYIFFNSLWYCTAFQLFKYIFS